MSRPRVRDAGCVRPWCHLVATAHLPQPHPLDWHLSLAIGFGGVGIIMCIVGFALPATRSGYRPPTLIGAAMMTFALVMVSTHLGDLNWTGGWR